MIVRDLPVGDRPRGARADPGRRGQTARDDRRLRRRRLERGGHLLAFVDDLGVRLIGVEAGGSSRGHSASLAAGTPGVLHGAYSYLLQDGDGQVLPAHSIAAGLDYPGVGPEHSFWRDTGRVTMPARPTATRSPSSAIWRVWRASCPRSSRATRSPSRARICPRDADLVIVNLSGRGDKDLDAIAAGRARP